MTAIDTHNSASDMSPSALRPTTATAHLARLYLASRRVPTALGLLAALGVLLAAALCWRWNIAGGPAAQQFVPLTIETAAASVIAVTTHGPFGECERATGRWLPYLRLVSAVVLTALAATALAIGASAGHLPGGNLAMLRNLGGITGTGLLTASAFGGAFGWTGPMACLLVTESALAAGWTTPWMWAARPPSDLGAALCVAVTFAAGAALVTIRGDRDRVTQR